MRNRILLALSLVLVLTTLIAPVAADTTADVRDLAVDYLTEEGGFDPADVDGVVVTDDYVSTHTGVRHVYLRQTVDGEPVNGANATLAVMDGVVIHVASNKFLVDLSDNATGELALSPSEARAAAAGAVSAGTTGLEDPETAYRALGDGTARRVYVVEVQTEHDWWVIDVDAETGEVVHQVNLVDHEDMAAIAATTARPSSLDTVLQGFENSDAVSVSEGTGNTPLLPAEQAIDGSSYNVYPMPVENPRDGDRRTVDNPASAQASPFGWHDTDGQPGPENSITRGNNVHAYADTIASPYVSTSLYPNHNQADPDPMSEPSGGDSLDFDFPIVSFDATPATYREAAVTNLFYWNNVMHDVTFHYGFDEAAGNFQQTNYSGLGKGGDAVNAEAQDGNFVLNANFATPSDGSPGRMQMYLWVDAFRDLAVNAGESARTTRSTQVRDGDVDSGVIAHEYGHGISNRLVGGPNTVGCLGSHDEREGEGWSDFWSYALTARPGEDGATPRGIGNYVVYYDELHPRQGPGIRITPYSTDFDINPSTYNTITTAAEPHGVGYVWATMLWDLYWAMVEEHGFHANPYDEWTAGGNNRTIQLVTDGMKFAPCEPSFVEARDAIIAAEAALTGAPANGVPGTDECLIWDVFARRGLGLSADAGDYRSKTDQTEAYDVPAHCE